eukprot:Tbor_TRINITY_DN5519_c0_g1::TRINITY_DN5519_c0_g1_i1::g.13479::m.13479
MSNVTSVNTNSLSYNNINQIDMIDDLHYKNILEEHHTSNCNRDTITISDDTQRSNCSNKKRKNNITDTNDNTSIYDDSSETENDNCHINNNCDTSNSMDIEESVSRTISSEDDVRLIYIKSQIVRVAGMLTVLSVFAIYTVPILALLLLLPSIHVIYSLRRPSSVVSEGNPPYQYDPMDRATCAVNMFLVMCCVGFTLSCFDVVVLLSSVLWGTDATDMATTSPTNASANNQVSKEKHGTMSGLHIGVDITINLCNIVGCVYAIFWVNKLEKYL